jgi:hypothetical protein
VVMGGGGTIRALSAEFLADLQRKWRQHGDTVLDYVAVKDPVNFFKGMVSLSKVIRLEAGAPGTIDRPRTPEEIVTKLEQQAGPQARPLFERFLKQLQQLQDEQQLAELAATSRERTNRRRERYGSALRPDQLLRGYGLSSSDSACQ